MFENLHPTKKHAFIDGLLCGIAMTAIVIAFHKDRQEMKAERKWAEDYNNAPK